METSNDDLFPLALLIDELKHDDVANRVAAMQKLDAIAIALGPERALNELVPFLNDVVQDDEEEVFAVMAEKLGGFVPLVGGHAHCEPLVRVLAVLLSMEEPIVRDNAVASLNQIGAELTDAEANGLFLDMVRDLAQGDWFLKKVSLCGLFKAVIVRVSATVRRELLVLYHGLVADDSPMVRRSAAKHLPVLIDHMTRATRENPASADRVDDTDLEIISKMFHLLINDSQDSVKLLSIDVLLSILRFFHSVADQSHNSDCLVSALKLIKDDSWRVRYAAADKFAEIAACFAASALDLLKLSDPFVGLMKDNEAEVRKAIASQLPAFCKLLNDPELTEKKIIPVVSLLSQDSHENVRAALASTVTGLCPILSEESTIDKLLPIFLNMLKDEFPDVRLNIISNLSIVNDTIGINLLSTSLLPAITELAQDSKWRVRLAIIEYIPKLANQLGEPFFNNELLTLCMSWLWDPVYAVRDAAVNNLRDLTVIFGSAWAEEHIVTRLLNIKDEKISDEDEGSAGQVDFSNFIIRITCLFVVSKLTPVIDQSVVVNKIIPFVSHLTADPVPNIRFNVAKSYLVIVEALVKAPGSDVTELIDNEIMLNLNVLQGDADVDVRYYANSSLESIMGLSQKV
ncbi:ARM repeat-containing protein [Metschnikowia bicuspidata var. bicuspidata NRRL YB-4993]|uniref:ARM repeat-containing protein n=1 Tax=Metschnikowia bicuspidata var. bicuspidata NRRL YB-4993 TaxID=869754 RepID=A0A1A0HAD5_9ASCO|nr:ARM repeat-containing protein [Metschnikowia bicuspidata var. bicuspidata NRRL YB-4993]OBA20965.1 ARM repeat-containing protein [Metschnikowia bicuspidata var. bicuspidata NRRL YB-4993]